MPLLDKFQQMLSASPVANASTGLDKVMASAGQGLDYLINDVIIGGIGRLMDAGTAKLTSMISSGIGGAAAVSSLGRTEDPYDQNFSAGNLSTPEIERSRSIEPAKAQEISQSLPQNVVAQLDVERQAIRQWDTGKNPNLVVSAQMANEADLGMMSAPPIPGRGPQQSVGMAV